MKIKDLIRVFLFLIILFLVFIIFINYFFVSQKISVTYYKVYAEFDKPIRIVQLTDLHDVQLGQSNEKVVSLVAEQQPDIVVMTGDMLNYDDSNTEVVSQLIRNLTEIAPVYYGYGNHEMSWEKTFHCDLEEIFTNSGAIVVNNSYVDEEVNGQELRIGGYMGYYRQPHMMTRGKERQQEELQFCQDFEATDRYKILLNHIPTAWLDWEYINEYPVDLIFSGHYHGGQWVLPIIGPVFAPNIGFNPPYAKGLYEGSKAICILSAGLGNEKWWHIRINNPPEVVVTDIIPKNRINSKI